MSDCEDNMSDINKIVMEGFWDKVVKKVKGMRDEYQQNHPFTKAIKRATGNSTGSDTKSDMHASMSNKLRQFSSSFRGD